MLPIYLDISDEARKIINNNIWCMFDLLEATCDGLSYAEILDGIFPTYILDENLDKCVKIVRELYSMSADKFEREYLSPFYEWTLYHTILWWLDVTDHINLYEIPKEISISKQDVDLHKTLNDIDNYFDFLFQDWDFLYVDKIYAIYKKSPAIIEKFFHIDMEQYIELMPRDLQEEYKKLSKTTVKDNGSSDEKEQYIVKNIYNFLQLEMIKAKKYENCNEVDLSDNIRNGLFFLFKEHGIDMERETRAGYAVTDLGELDFYIYSMENGAYEQIAIGENKQWGEYRDSIRQLLGYMDCNTQFGFTIIYNKDTQLKTVLDGGRRILNEFNIDGKFKVLGEIEEVDGLIDTLRTCHENPEKPGNYFILYHFVFIVYRLVREQAAIWGRKRARNKKSIKKEKE